jgi:hypothetical protein
MIEMSSKIAKYGIDPDTRDARKNWVALKSDSKSDPNLESDFDLESDFESDSKNRVGFQKATLF